MGLICCRPEVNQNKPNTGLNDELIEEIRYPKINIADIDSSELISNIDLYKLFSEKAITTLYNRIHEYINEPDIKKNDRLLINENLQLLKNDFKLWIKLSNQEQASYKLHTYYSELNFPFTPELLYLYYLNENSENFEKLHKDLDRYEILHQSFKDDYCFLLLNYRTKASAVIESKGFLVLRVVRRNKDKTFSEFQLSINRTHLVELEGIKSIREQMENEATVYINGSEFEMTSEGYVLKSFTKVDILSQLGILAVKPVIKTSAKQSKNLLMELLVEFLLVKQDLPKLKWFTDSITEKKKIFDENLKLLGDMKLDVSHLNPELQQIYINKYAWKKKKASDNFIKREDNHKPSANEFYETVEDINDNKDKMIANINTRIDVVAKELGKKVEAFKTIELERKLSNMNDDTLKHKVTQKIDDLNQEIEKRSNATKEMLENSYNEGSYVEDMQRKVEIDLHKMSEELNHQLKKVAKKNFVNHNSNNNHRKPSMQEDKADNILNSDHLSEIPQTHQFHLDDMVDEEDMKEFGDKELINRRISMNEDNKELKNIIEHLRDQTESEKDKNEVKFNNIL